MYVRLDDWDVGARIAVKRTYEQHVTACMRPLLQPGQVFVDVGANIGYFTLLAAANVGPTGHVHAFEPGRKNCDLLQLSLAANGFDHVTLHPMAVADIDGTVGFSIGDSNGGIDRHNPTNRPFQVPAVRLDAFLQDQPRIDLVKMDVEGAEGLALAGMAQLLRRHQPVIFTEFSPLALQTVSGVSPEAYLDHLRDLGYVLHVIHRYRGQNPSPQTNAEILHDFAEYGSDHLDLVAYPRVTP